MFVSEREAERGGRGRGRWRLREKLDVNGFFGSPLAHSWAKNANITIVALCGAKFSLLHCVRNDARRPPRPAPSIERDDAIVGLFSGRKVSFGVARNCVLRSFRSRGEHVERFALVGVQLATRCLYPRFLFLLIPSHSFLFLLFLRLRRLSSSTPPLEALIEFRGNVRLCPPCYSTKRAVWRRRREAHRRTIGSKKAKFNLKREITERSVLADEYVLRVCFANIFCLNSRVEHCRR